MPPSARPGAVSRRRRRTRLLGALLASLVASPTGAAPADALWSRVQALCDATAREPPPPRAAAVALKARHEHALWGGHRIDHTGRLHRFGLVEFEGEAERSGTGAAPLRTVGWWNVWRYWAGLDDVGLVPAGELRVTAFAGAVGERNPDAERPRKDFALAAVFRALGATPPGSMQEALKESAIRAMMSDLPWSAVFVSAVVHEAVPALRAEHFAFSSSHIDYITQAVETAQAEAAGRPAATLYRACPIHATRPRPGDLLCYQRDPACAGAPATALLDLVAGTPVPDRPACRAISGTHCDVVARVDAPARKVLAIGGNVFQSVAERRLNLTPRGALSPNQGEAACRAARRRQDGAEPPAEKPCSLNHRDWFVLLQVRGGEEEAHLPESDGSRLR